MFEALQNAMSSVRAQTRKAMVHAHNTSNFNTKGARPQRVEMQSRAGGGVEARVETSTEPRGIDPARERAGLLSSERAIEANLKTIQSSDKMLGVVIDIEA